MSLLDVQGLTVQYGGVLACSDVDLQVAAGSVCGLIGPNGAGKTTFVDAVTGFTKHSGRVVFNGADISARPPHQRVHLGMARTFQTMELYEDLTVRENLKVARIEPRRRRAGAGQGAELDAHMTEVLRALDIFSLLGRFPGELSQGQRKRISVARALVSRPSLLLLDEPGAGLDSWESLELAEHLRKLSTMGVAVLMIDHDMDLVLSICTDIYVLEFGKVIAHGVPSAIQVDPRVIAAYLGQPDTAHSTSRDSDVNP